MKQVAVRGVVRVAGAHEGVHETLTPGRAPHPAALVGSQGMKELKQLLPTGPIIPWVPHELNEECVELVRPHQIVVSPPLDELRPGQPPHSQRGLADPNKGGAHSRLQSRCHQPNMSSALLAYGPGPGSSILIDEGRKVGEALLA